ncbi:MAG: DUF4416 family protein [Pseudomonadota bacterium]
MSTPKTPDPAKLVISLLMNDRGILEGVLPLLEEKFGTVDSISPWLEFDYTSYYVPEMGTPLFRRMVVFKSLVKQDELAGIKVFTNSLETRWALDGKRNLNIDPGYLLLSRFILATGKDYSHRIYLDQGIYGDLTLIYRQGGYRSLEWTYPDYAGEAITGFLHHVRDRYALELKQFRGANS